jgi:hypothetical protein
MKKQIAIALATLACAAATSAAHAGNVHWSVGINLPPIGTVVSNAPVYSAPAPVYYQPAPVYYQPSPVYYQPAPVYVSPPQVVYRPVPATGYYRAAPVVVYGGGRWHGQRDWRDGRHDEYGDRRDGRWGEPERRRH